MKISIWSIYYDPEPTGIAPVATNLAGQLAERGHEVRVVTSHPHYPKPAWGSSVRPTERRRGGIPVVELPLWTGRSSAPSRALSELSYAVTQSIQARREGPADMVLAVIPSVSVMPAVSAYADRSGAPVVVWLQDIVSGLANVSGLRGVGVMAAAAKRLEDRAFARADAIVSISPTFEAMLLGRGVPAEKIVRIDQAAGLWSDDQPQRCDEEPVAISIGNVGLTQNLHGLASAFQESSALRALGARLRVTGEGVAMSELRGVATQPTTSLLGLLETDELRGELARARVGIVSQGAGKAGFNLPSKLGTYMAAGLPVVAVVEPASGVADVIQRSGAGWVLDCRDLPRACRDLAELMTDRKALDAAGASGRAFAERYLSPTAAAAQFEALFERLTRERSASGG